MRFLADENCDIAVVRALRDAGHDVALVRERRPGATDEAVAELSRKEARILLTEDKDFGQLVQALSGARVGVILLRFPARARSQIGANVVRVVEMFSEELERGFTVPEPGHVRITRL